MMFKLALRNLFRNKRRTILTIILIGSGLGALILYNGLILGMRESIIKSTTSVFNGDAKITRRNFLDDFELELTIDEPVDLSKYPEVISYTPRTFSMAMLNSASDSMGISLVGIDYLKEIEVSKIKDSIIKGDYLSNNPLEILIGSKIAKDLNLDIGDRVVVMTSQAYKNEINQELFRIKGITHFNSNMDKMFAFINISKAKSLLNIKGPHEIIIRFNKSSDSYDPNDPIFKDFAETSLESMHWTKTISQIKAMLDMSNFGPKIVSIFLTMVIILTVVNSMLMSIHERDFELGLMQALGTRSSEVFNLILLESIILGVFSGILGMFLGFIFSYTMSIFGLDFSGIDMGGSTLTEPLRTIFAIHQFTLYPAMVLLLTIAASIYPAVLAAKMIPSVAMRKL